MGKEFAGNMAPLVCILMDCSALPLILVDVLIVALLTTPTDVKLHCICAVCVYKTDCVKHQA